MIKATFHYASEEETENAENFIYEDESLHVAIITHHPVWQKLSIGPCTCGVEPPTEISDAVIDNIAEKTAAIRVEVF